MNTSLQEVIAALPAAERLELAQWIIASVRESLEMPVPVPEVTPDRLDRAIQEALDNPRGGRTPEELFASFEQQRLTRSGR